MEPQPTESTPSIGLTHLPRWIGPGGQHVTGMWEKNQKVNREK